MADLPAVRNAHHPSRRPTSVPSPPMAQVPIDLECRVEFTYLPDRRAQTMQITLTLDTPDMADIIAKALAASWRVSDVRRVN